MNTQDAGPAERLFAQEALVYESERQLIEIHATLPKLNNLLSRLKL